MIILKDKEEILKLREAGRITARALNLAGSLIKPGVTTAHIDFEVRKYIESQGAAPSFLNYGDFPASTCISVNDVIIHGVPSAYQVLKNGDIISIDVGAKIDGYHGDCAATFVCGEATPEALALVEDTKESLMRAIKVAVVGNRIGDISHAVQAFLEPKGYGVVRDFVGHGVGRNLHEDPSVPNFGTKGRGLRLEPGLVIAIEPMVNAGSYEVDVMEDGSAKTKDGSLSAHFEHTIAIMTDGPIILTDLD
jgi:methionyl aminopeptidase